MPNAYLHVCLHIQFIKQCTYMTTLDKLVHFVKNIRHASKTLEFNGKYSRNQKNCENLLQRQCEEVS